MHHGLTAASEPGTPYVWCIFRVWIHETREWDWVAYLGVIVGSKMGSCDVAPEIEVRNLFVEVPRLDLGYEVPKIEVNSHEVNATTTAERIREAKHELYVQLERTGWRPRAVNYWLREEHVLKLPDYDGHPLRSIRPVEPMEITGTGQEYLEQLMLMSTDDISGNEKAHRRFQRATLRERRLYRDDPENL